MVVFLTSHAFFGLDAIGDEIEEPFSTSSNCLPLAAISRDIEIELWGLIDDPQPPQPSLPDNGVLRRRMYPARWSGILTPSVGSSWYSPRERPGISHSRRSRGRRCPGKSGVQLKSSWYSIAFLDRHESHMSRWRSVPVDGFPRQNLPPCIDSMEVHDRMHEGQVA